MISHLFNIVRKSVRFVKRPSHPLDQKKIAQQMGCCDFFGGVWDMNFNRPFTSLRY
jgi:hypothetical protein